MCGEAKVVTVCRMSLRLTLALLLPAAIRAGFYDCTDSVECSSTYGAPTVGTEADMEAACDADANCVAYQYNAAQVSLHHTIPRVRDFILTKLCLPTSIADIRVHLQLSYHRLRPRRQSLREKAGASANRTIALNSAVDSSNDTSTEPVA